MTQDIFYKKLCAEIRRKRKEAGYNQQEMADFINVTRPSYVNLELNRHSTTVYNMLLVCQLLKIEIPAFPKAFMDRRMKESFSGSAARKEKKKQRLKKTIKEASEILSKLK